VNLHISLFLIRGLLTIDIPFADSIDLQYKITRGNWSEVEVDKGGNHISNRSVFTSRDTVINISVSNWADKISKKHTASPNVHLLSDSFPMNALASKTRIWIYLPPSYKNSKKNYPVIYMQDGQNLFDKATTAFGTEWEADETMDSLVSKGDREYIIVGIGSGNERLHDYLPYYSKMLGEAKGKSYGEFMVKQLVPYVDAHYRTVKSRTSRSVAGSSMGALISLYCLMEYPDVFSAAGVFSCSFQVIDNFQQRLYKDPGNKKLKLFLYAGDKESETLVPYTELMKQQLEKKQKYYG
jgi:metallo-beta-lactamase class B